MNPKDMTPEEFRSFLIDQLNGVLAIPGGRWMETPIQRAIMSMAVASLATAPLPEIIRWQSHYVAP